MNTRAGVLVVVVGWLFSCGSLPGPDGGTGGGTGTGGGVQAGGGGGASGGGSGWSIPVDGGTARYGVVAITEDSVGIPANASVVAFFAELTRAPRPNCTSGTYGPCTTLSCVPIDGGLIPDVIVSHGAGTVTITGTAQDGGTVVFPWNNATNSYSYPFITYRDTHLFNSGDVLTMSAAGGEVPAFSGNVVAPGTLTLTSPDSQTCLPGFPASCTLDRSSPLTVTWSGGVSGTAIVMLEVNTDRYTPNQVSCTVPAATGSLTIPAAALATLPAALNGTLTLESQGLTELDVGAYHLFLQLNATKSYLPVTTTP